jgi:phosphoglycolate phosphatase-like HAD superfamily hydrolase
MIGAARRLTGNAGINAAARLRVAYGQERMLLLFDIDGTLLRTVFPRQGEAMCAAAQDIYGVKLAASAIVDCQPAGKTDQQIAREMLRAVGVGETRINERLPAWQAQASTLYSQQPDLADAGAVLPGAVEALLGLEGGPDILALLTGNLQSIARRKLEGVGLAHFFDFAASAFGSDHEDRAELVRLAYERSALAAAETVVIGDTPRDIACARAAGARVVAVSTGSFGAEALAAADEVLTDLRELGGVLDRWRERAR